MRPSVVIAWPQAFIAEAIACVWLREDRKVVVLVRFDEALPSVEQFIRSCIRTLRDAFTLSKTCCEGNCASKASAPEALRPLLSETLFHSLNRTHNESLFQIRFRFMERLSPGEVAERHRKKVSSRARVREHTARIQSCGHLGNYIHEFPKHIIQIANLSLGAFGPPVESSCGRSRLALLFCRTAPTVPGCATVAIWLILPVVIRLSQRLSHARLRIKSFL